MMSNLPSGVEVLFDREAALRFAAREYAAGATNTNRYALRQAAIAYADAANRVSAALTAAVR